MEDFTFGSRTSLRDMLVDAEQRLTRAGVPSPSFDAAELAAYVLGTTRTRMVLQDPFTPEQRVQYEQLITQRCARVPLQHLTGVAGFRRFEVAVGPGVFIPRPETELLTEAAVRTLGVAAPGERIAVDLCAGSGAVAIALATEVAGSQVHAVELSADALTWTRRNATAFSADIATVGSTLNVVQADAMTCAEPGEPLAALAGSVSVVTANPPYVPDDMVPNEIEVREYDPALALFGGADGLDVVRGIIRTAAILLRRGGLLVMEHADVQGADAGLHGVPGTLSAHLCDADLETMTHTPAGQPLWTRVDDRPDLNHKPRFTLATRR